MIPVSRRDFLAAGLTLAGASAWPPPPQPDEPPTPGGRPPADPRPGLATAESGAGRGSAPSRRRPTSKPSRPRCARRSSACSAACPTKAGVPPVRTTGTIEADDYVIEKLAYESFPGYFVPALLYRPKNVDVARCRASSAPAAIRPTARPRGAYQILHINLAKRGYVVLTYDPVGQGERSQFWDAEKRRSRFNLSCGEHAVLGNPLYLLGTSLARYRIWDGMRGLDYLASRPEVDPARIGCVGNSGGGTLTAYIAALDPRVTAAAIGCYITTLPRRMANRIQEDPSADPEQDIFGFVSEGIDHAGLLALRVPRPTLIGSARQDFFPIEGARESFAEAKRLYEVAGAGDRIAMAEAPGRHGLTRRSGRPSTPGSTAGSPAGRTRPRRPRSPSSPAPTRSCSSAPTARSTSRCDRGRSCRWRGRSSSGSRDGPACRSPSCSASIPNSPTRASPRSRRHRRPGQTMVVCINGNESRDWREEAEFLRRCDAPGHAVVVVDPRGVGPSRPPIFAEGRALRRPARAASRRTSPTTRSSSASPCSGCAWRTSWRRSSTARGEGRAAPDRPLRPPRRGAGGLPGGGRLPGDRRRRLRGHAAQLPAALLGRGPADQRRQHPARPAAEVRRYPRRPRPDRAAESPGRLGDRRTVQPRTARAVHPAVLEQGAETPTGLAPGLNAATVRRDLPARRSISSRLSGLTLPRD